MQYKVDWFTYAKNLWGKRETPAPIPQQAYAAVTRQHLPDYMPEPEKWKVCNPRRSTVFGYDYEGHCKVYLGFDGIVTVEHTGLGCSFLDELDLLFPLIAREAEHCSRIDLAADILTDADPFDFVNMRTDKRTTSHKDELTTSGRTYNVGSIKSERHAKVYRYTAPHPRHMFLRIEYTFHRRDAKNIARECDEYSLAALCKMAGKRYGWTHPDYQPDLNATDMEIKAWRPDRRAGKRVFWLYNQVIPAIVKTARAGEIDLEEFIRDIRKQAQV